MKLVLKNTKFNLDVGSRICHVAKEGRNVGKVIVIGDFKQAALNAGMLALYVLPAISSANAQLKIGMNSTSKRMVLGNMAAAGLWNSTAK